MKANVIISAIKLKPRITPFFLRFVISKLSKYMKSLMDLMLKAEKKINRYAMNSRELKAINPGLFI